MKISGGNSLFPILVLCVFAGPIPQASSRHVPTGRDISGRSSDRQGRFLGLLGFLTDGLLLDADFYSDEDKTDVKIKTQRPVPAAGFLSQGPAGNWAYIPIPYFIPSQLYNNLFAQPSQYLSNVPPNPPGAITSPAFGSPNPNPFPDTTHLNPVINSPIAQLESQVASSVSSSSSSALATPRGRLTRQASKQTAATTVGDVKKPWKAAATKKRKRAGGNEDGGDGEKKQEGEAEEEEAATGAEVQAVVDAEANDSTTSAAENEREETTEISTTGSEDEDPAKGDTSSGVNSLPSTGLNMGIKNGESVGDGDTFANATTESTGTGLESFEVSGWDYLNNGSGVKPSQPPTLPTASAVDYTDNLKSNQTSSSYYRQPSAAQSFDPDGISFTTWYPETEKLQELSESVPSSGPSQFQPYPFRPSQEFNEASLFKPISTQISSAQVGLEPPTLPEYTYAKK